jgi:hypothetical protein
MKTVDEVVGAIRTTHLLTMKIVDGVAAVKHRMINPEMPVAVENLVPPAKIVTLTRTTTNKMILPFAAAAAPETNPWKTTSVGVATKTVIKTIAAAATNVKATIRTIGTKIKTIVVTARNAEIADPSVSKSISLTA